MNQEQEQNTRTFYYISAENIVHGPHTEMEMQQWYQGCYFHSKVPISVDGIKFVTLGELMDTNGRELPFFPSKHCCERANLVREEIIRSAESMRLKNSELERKTNRLKTKLLKEKDKRKNLKHMVANGLSPDLNLLNSQRAHGEEHNRMTLTRGADIDEERTDGNSRATSVSMKMSTVCCGSSHHYQPSMSASDKLGKHQLPEDDDFQGYGSLKNFVALKKQNYLLENEINGLKGVIILRDQEKQALLEKNRLLEEEFKNMLRKYSPNFHPHNEEEQSEFTTPLIGVVAEHSSRNSYDSLSHLNQYNDIMETFLQNVNARERYLRIRAEQSLAFSQKRVDELDAELASLKSVCSKLEGNVVILNEENSENQKNQKLLKHQLDDEILKRLNSEVFADILLCHQRDHLGLDCSQVDRNTMNHQHMLTVRINRDPTPHEHSTRILDDVKRENLMNSKILIRENDENVIPNRMYLRSSENESFSTNSTFYSNNPGPISINEKAPNGTVVVDFSSTEESYPSIIAKTRLKRSALKLQNKDLVLLKKRKT